MTVRNSAARTVLPSEDDLKKELLAELQHPKASGEPDVIIEGDPKRGIHLFVIWSRWVGLEQVVRSRIIFDAYEEWKGVAASMSITVSMGLTPDEAKSMGFTAA